MKKWLPLALTVLLVGCSQLECKEGFKAEDKGDLKYITCIDPQFEFGCEMGSYSKIGDMHTCRSSDGKTYSVKAITPIHEEEEEEEVTEEPKPDPKPNIPVPVAPPPPPSPPPPPTASSSIQANCTQHDWDCTPWGECTKKAKQFRECELANDSCYMPLSVKPPTSQENSSCISEFEKNLDSLRQSQNQEIEDRFSRWDAIHKEMIQLGRDFVNQGSQAGGVYSQLNSIETEFVSRYNEYIRAYNDHLMPSRYSIMSSLEKAIEKKIQEFRALPQVVF